MPSTDDKNPDFREMIKEILEIPGASKRQIAEWAGVDPSSVTRWYQGGTPSDPVAILRRLAPHVEQAREDAAAAAVGVKRTEVESWRNLVGDMDPGLRQQVAQTGLLASTYHVFTVWDPRSVRKHECDIVIMRYFSNVWVDMSRRLYNIGDATQTATLDEHADDNEAPFGEHEPIGQHVGFKLTCEGQLGRALARLHIQLDLTELKARGDVIATIDDFGYRYRARRAIVDGRVNPSQTNEFLGAPVVLPCRRFRLVVCVPKSSVVGSPSALSLSNRAMLQQLLRFDKAEAEEIESLMWPLGRRYEMSSAADAQLKPLAHVETLIDNLPHGLQEALSRPADLDEPRESIHDILGDPRSACFLLDLHQPDPSLTYTIVWRLNDIQTKAVSDRKPASEA